MRRRVDRLADTVAENSKGFACSYLLPRLDTRVPVMGIGQPTSAAHGSTSDHRFAPSSHYKSTIASEMRSLPDLVQVVLSSFLHVCSTSVPTVAEGASGGSALSDQA